MERLINLLLLIIILNEISCFDPASKDAETSIEETFVRDFDFVPDTKSMNQEFFEEFQFPKGKFKEQKPETRNMNNYCQSFRSCAGCIRATEYPCGWCHDFGCTANPLTHCPQIINALDNEKTSSYTAVCPRIVHDGPIFIPAGVRMNLKVKLNVLDSAVYRKDIICQIRLKERVTRLKGFIISDLVYCYPVSMKALIEDRGTFRLIWGGAEPYSNEIPLFIYRCEMLAHDCESCRQLPPYYGCGWCDKTRKCAVSDKCDRNFLKWTLNRISCGNKANLTTYTIAKDIIN